jgi:hypothetical protein
LATLAATLAGVVLLCVDVVVGRGPAWAAAGSVMFMLTFLWAALPRVANRVASTPRNPPPSADREPDA